MNWFVTFPNAALTAAKGGEMERARYIADMIRHRQEAADRALQARAKGYPEVAVGFEQLVSGWNKLLARNGVKPLSPPYPPASSAVP